MQGTTSTSSSRGVITLGVILVLAGAAALVLQAAGIDLLDAIEDNGWPLFVIVPGVGLLALSLLPQPPRGLGFAIAGMIVLTVGGILLYQQLSDHWESWSYAWTLVALVAPGIALLVYGGVFRLGRLVRVGAVLAAVGVVAFLAGMWFYETLFDTGTLPIDLAPLWPLVLVVVGAVIVAAAIVRGDQRHAT
jgi:hypothetical protein